MITYSNESLDSYFNQINCEAGIYKNNEIIGVCQYVLYDKELTISYIFIRPEFRRQGFASRLITYVKKINPEYKYKPSLKTELGAKFIHKDINESIIKYLKPKSYKQIINDLKYLDRHELEQSIIKAVWEENYSLVKMLLDAGANVKAIDKIVDFDLLDIASYTNNKLIINLLKSYLENKPINESNPIFKPKEGALDLFLESIRNKYSFNKLKEDLRNYKNNEIDKMGENVKNYILSQTSKIKTNKSLKIIITFGGIRDSLTSCLYHFNRIKVIDKDMTITRKFNLINYTYIGEDYCYFGNTTGLGIFIIPEDFIDKIYNK